MTSHHPVLARSQPINALRSFHLMDHKRSYLRLQSLRINTARTLREFSALSTGEISYFLTPRGENLVSTPSPRFYPEISAHYNMNFMEASEFHILYNNHGSILGKGKKIFFSSQRPGRN